MRWKIKIACALHSNARKQTSQQHNFCFAKILRATETELMAFNPIMHNQMVLLAVINDLVRA